jgi:hypothetical protein
MHLPSLAKTRRQLRGIARSIAAALAICVGLLASGNVSAVVLKYEIEGTFHSGTLSGLGFFETFTFDDASKPAELGSVPWTTPLLSYSLEVDGHTKHWTLADWPLEHTFSQWVDANGFLNSLARVATPGPQGQPPAFSEYFDDGAPDSRSKHVKWYDWSVWNTFETDSESIEPLVAITVVPEPSSLAMLLVGLIALIVTLATKRRPRDASGDQPRSLHLIRCH